jgi:multidrug efflux pump subunit AcrA (membrane-fusion protein)
MVSDQKAVFATVESRRVVPARARIGGTVAELTVREGDHVELGQLLAAVGDEKIALQMKSLDAQIAGLEARLAQARTDLSRA